MKVEEHSLFEKISKKIESDEEFQALLDEINNESNLPQWMKFHFLHRAHLICKEDYEVALDIIEKELEATVPENEIWRIYINRGIAHKGLKHWECAICDFKRCLEYSQAQEWFWRVHRNLGDCYFALEDWHHAIYFYKRALEDGLCENKCCFHQRIAECYSYLANNGKVIKHLFKALMHEPPEETKWVLRYEIARAYTMLGEDKRALLEYEEALRYNPPNKQKVKVLCLTAGINYELENWQKAAEYYKQMLEYDLSPKKAKRAMAYWGASLLKMGVIKEGMEIIIDSGEKVAILVENGKLDMRMVANIKEIK